MTTEQDIRNKVKIFRPKSQEINLFDPNLNDNSTRLIHFKDNHGNRVKIWVFSNLLKLEISLTTSLLFSLNIPDKVCLANKMLKEIIGIGNIYTDDSINDQIINCFELIEDELKTFEFKNHEGLTVYRNSLQVTLTHSRQLLPEIEICRKLKTLIESNFPDKTKRTDYSDLPANLRPILLQFEKLAVSDDFKREELIEGLRSRQREDLIKAIGPKLDEINLFLDTFDQQPLTEGAIGLQCLAELTIELTNGGKQNHS